MSADWPLVKAGQKGPRVKALQQRLLLHRGADLAADGDFGPGTTAALTAFQEANGLDADGVFRPATEKAVRAFQERVHLSADAIVGPHTWQLLTVES